MCLGRGIVFSSASFVIFTLLYLNVVCVISNAPHFWEYYSVSRDKSYDE